MKRAINKWVISIFAITMLLMIGIEGKAYMDNDKKSTMLNKCQKLLKWRKLLLNKLKILF